MINQSFNLLPMIKSISRTWICIPFYKINDKLFWLWLNDCDFPLNRLFFLCILAVVALHFMQSGTFGAEDIYYWGDCIKGWGWLTCVKNFLLPLLVWASCHHIWIAFYAFHILWAFISLEVGCQLEPIYAYYYIYFPRWKNSWFYYFKFKSFLGCFLLRVTS